MWFGMHGHGRGPRGGWPGGPFGPGFDMDDEGGGGRGPRGRRVFDGGELRLVLLKLIADEARHGYELIRAVEELTDGAYAPSPGVIYPTLALLDEMGLAAEQRSDDARKRFAATDAGRAHLDERAAEVERLFARLASLREHRRRHHGSPVRRALRNLGETLRHRFAHGDVSDERRHEVAAMIDDLARRIEKLS